MKRCELCDTADVEMYFYGEFEPGDRARVEGTCAAASPAASVSKTSTRSATRWRRAPQSTHLRPATGPAS